MNGTNINIKIKYTFLKYKIINHKIRRNYKKEKELKYIGISPVRIPFRLWTFVTISPIIGIFYFKQKYIKSIGM